MAWLRSRSLFWTFAAAFLAVLLLGTLLQAVVVLTFVHPMIQRLEGDRARISAQEAAQAISDLQDEPTTDAIHQTLAMHGGGRSGVILVFLGEDGSVILDHAAPPAMGRGLRWLLMDQEGGEPLHERQGSPERRPFGRRPRMDVAGRIDVVRSGRVIGEVVALVPNRRLHELPRLAPGGWTVFLPVAILLAGAAGLFIFQLMIRRLRKLEDLTLRVAAGDLSARVADPGPDELGRLGARLNAMIASLERAQDQLAANDRQRRQLLADISHELATPLTSIRGYAETLQDTSVEVSAGEREAYLNNIHEESRRMDLLIEDLLELSRLESGTLELSPERIDWAALARNTVERLRPRFEEAGLDLSWSGGDDPAWVEADGRRLEQMLDNLLFNALRYVPERGSVDVGVTAVGAGGVGAERDSSSGTEGAERRYCLYVQDDGPGFDESDLPQLFDRFYRADASRTTDGSGLGLAIVREIAVRHGGSVRAANRPSGGARLEVELAAAD